MRAHPEATKEFAALPFTSWLYPEGYAPSRPLTVKMALDNHIDHLPSSEEVQAEEQRKVHSGFSVLRMPLLNLMQGAKSASDNAASSERAIDLFNSKFKDGIKYLVEYKYVFLFTTAT